MTGKIVIRKRPHLVVHAPDEEFPMGSYEWPLGWMWRCEECAPNGSWFAAHDGMQYALGRAQVHARSSHGVKL